MADRRLQAMRRVAAIRSAERAGAATALYGAVQQSASADAALTAATGLAEAAFVAWSAQTRDMRFDPDAERRHAVLLIDADRGQINAKELSVGADAALTQARQGLCRADAAVEQSGRIVAKLHRADRRRREERRLAEHADTVTQHWSRV
ncbi:hypothetical protein ACFQ15_08145 [Sphingomonas hankookensis]|uniref:hypothetical protein n=1 Tax=Sphingomonas hankookensis TaxID=563996 RepID=UPI001F565C9A|nr:hypothetical protein [Sphingomonas hankookensis]